MSPKPELDSFRIEFRAQAPPEIRDAIVRDDLEVAASGKAQRALKAGDLAPNFPLPGACGRYIHLKDLLARGPIALSFYRGGWWPYCNPELRALRRILPEIMPLGAGSPQNPDASLSTAEKNALVFLVLSDTGFRAPVVFEQTKRRTSCKHSEMTT